MSGRLFLTIFTLFAITLVACSDGGSDEYLDLREGMRADVLDVFGGVQRASAQPNDVNADDAKKVTRQYRLEMSQISGKLSAMNFRWNAVEPPEKFQVHYDFTSQALGKLATAIDLLARGAAYIENELTAFFRNYDEGTDLIDEGLAVLNEASEFMNLADRELQ